MTITTDTPRVWIGCLACYNGGRLVGDWYDAAEAGDVTVAQVHNQPSSTVLHGYDSSKLPEPDSSHEELWVMDHDGFRGALEGECSPATAQRIAEVLDEVDSAGIDVDAFIAWANYESVPIVDASRDQFTDKFRGHWSSEEEYAEDFASEMGLLSVPKRKPWGGYDDRETERNPLADFVDWDKYAQWLFTDLNAIDAPGGGIWVFWAS